MSKKISYLPGVALLIIALINALLDNYAPLIGLAIGSVLLFFVSRYEKYRRAKYVEKME